MTGFVAKVQFHFLVGALVRTTLLNKRRENVVFINRFSTPETGAGQLCVGRTICL